MASANGRKSIFITGAASGMGRETAKLFHDKGWFVGGYDVNAEGLASLEKELGSDNCITATLDVTDRAQYKATLDAFAAATDGKMDILFNNAGIADGSTVEDTDFETWKRVQAIDTDSVFLGCKYALPLMKAHAPGSIINTSSIAGLIAGHNMASYNAAKAGVWLLSKSVALHCAKRGYRIRCNSIHPTFVDTPILDSMQGGMSKEELKSKLARQVPLGVIGDADDVAYAVIFLASDESKFITGAELKIDGGISAM
mgnify:CR=1 FL=1